MTPGLRRRSTRCLGNRCLGNRSGRCCFSALAVLSSWSGRGLGRVSRNIGRRARVGGAGALDPCLMGVTLAPGRGQASLTLLGLDSRLAPGFALLLGSAGVFCGVLDQWAGGGGAGPSGPARGDEAALLDGICDHSAHERPSPDGVVIARDHVLDEVWVTVGVDNSHDRDPELVGLGNRNVFLLGIDDEHGIREPCHVADSAEVAGQLFQLSGQNERFLLRHRLEVASNLHSLVLLHLLDATGDGAEVRQHSAEPALIDVGHAALIGITGNRVLRLLLGAYREHRATRCHQITYEGVRQIDLLQRLVEINYINAVALTEDESLHLRVPSPGLVPEVNPGLQQLFHCDDGHGCSFPSVGPDPCATPRSSGDRGCARDEMTGQRSCWAGASLPQAVLPRTAQGQPASSSHLRGARSQAVSRNGELSRERSCSTALVWIWQTRLSVTPSTSPICAKVRLS